MSSSAITPPFLLLTAHNHSIILNNRSVGVWPDYATGSGEKVLPCMLSDALPDMDFLTWFGTLSDKEQCAVLEEVRAQVAELGITVDEKPPTADDPLNLYPGVYSHIFLN